MTMDFTGASLNMAGGLSAADERPLSINAQMSAASFGSDFEAAQLVSALGSLGSSPPDVPLEDQGTSDISEDPFPAEQMMWLGVTLPHPIELRPDDTAAGTEDASAPLEPNDSKRMSRAELTHWIKAGLAPVGEPRAELSADPRSVSTLDPGLRFTPDPMSPAISSPLSTIDERLLADASLDDMRLLRGDQTLAQPTVAEELQSFDASAPDAENTVPVDRPT